MTPIELVDMLVDFLKEVVKEYDLATKTEGVSKAPEIHSGYLPPKIKGDDTSDFPYIIVRYLSEEDSSENTVSIRLLIGTYSEDEQNGWRDTLNIVTRAKIAFKKKRVFGPFSLTDKITAELFEEQPFPFWFAVMDLNFNAPQIQTDWSEQGFDF